MITSPYLIGIAGGTGSGKSTAARFMANSYPQGEVIIISFDDYYKDQPRTTLEQRAKINYDHPDSLDHSLLTTQLRDLKEGKAVEKPRYDFATHSRRGETQTIKPTQILIVEGILALYFETLRQLYDRTYFIDAPADIRFIRRLKRDVRERGRNMYSVINQYITTVRPMHEQYVEPTKSFADVVVNGMGKWEKLSSSSFLM